MEIVKIIEDDFLNYEGEYSLTFFNYGCNFKCVHCIGYNYEYVQDKANIIGESLELFDKHINPLYTAITLLGGEPTLFDCEKVLLKAKQKGLKTKLFTNGSYPYKLRELLEKGLLDYISLDVKALKNVGNTVGFNCSDKVYIIFIKECLNLIKNYGIPYEIRTTKCLENKEDIVRIKEFLIEEGMDINKYIVQEDIREKIYDDLSR